MIILITLVNLLFEITISLKTHKQNTYINNSLLNSSLNNFTSFHENSIYKPLIINSTQQDNDIKKYISEDFWISYKALKSGLFGFKIHKQKPANFIVLKNIFNNFLSCDEIGNASVAHHKISYSALWIPLQVNENVFVFRSWWGAYLGVNNDGFLDCSSREVKEDEMFYLHISNGNCTGVTPEFINLQSLNNSKYLSFTETKILFKNEINMFGIMFGYYNINHLCILNLDNFDSEVSSLSP